MNDVERRILHGELKGGGGGYTVEEQVVEMEVGDITGSPPPVYIWRVTDETLNPMAEDSTRRVWRLWDMRHSPPVGLARSGLGIMTDPRSP